MVVGLCVCVNAVHIVNEREMKWIASTVEHFIGVKTLAGMLL